MARNRNSQAMIEALARGETITRAADLSGVSVSTVSRRMKDPDFMREVDQYRSSLTSDALGQLIIASDKAISNLVMLLKSESDAVRLGASRAILANLVKLRDSVEFSNEIQLLRDEINAIKNRA